MSPRSLLAPWIRIRLTCAGPSILIEGSQSMPIKNFSLVHWTQRGPQLNARLHALRPTAIRSLTGVAASFDKESSLGFTRVNFRK